MTFPRDPNQDGNARVLLDPGAPRPASPARAVEASTIDPRQAAVGAFLGWRFFPQGHLSVYAAPALAAIDAVVDDDPDRWVALPLGIQPEPVTARPTDDGGLEIQAGDLFRILHLHQVADGWLDL